MPFWLKLDFRQHDYNICLFLFTACRSASRPVRAHTGRARSPRRHCPQRACRQAGGWSRTRRSDGTWRTTWAAGAMPHFLARVASLPSALAPLGERSSFVTDCAALALDSLQTSTAELAHAQCVSRGLWTDATVAPLLAPLDSLCGADAGNDSAAEDQIHAIVASVAGGVQGQQPASASPGPTSRLAAASCA